MTFRKRANQALMRRFRSGRGQKLLERVGSHLDLWRGYGAGAFVQDSGETAVFDLLLGHHPPSEPVVIFDVGANLGEFTAAALGALGPSARIHAFEPAREVFDRFLQRFVGNDRVVPNNFALGPAPGERPLFGGGHDIGMASLVQRRLGDGKTSQFQETVKVMPLSDYCVDVGIDRINLLKMDVEGFELEVLLGAKNLFDNGGIDVCSFEFGGCNLDSRTFLRDFFEFFTPYGMHIFRITPTGTMIELPRYHEQLEKFTTTNYVAVSREMSAA